MARTNRHSGEDTNCAHHTVISQVGKLASTRPMLLIFTRAHHLSFADGIRLMPLLVEGHVMQAQPDAVPPHIDLKVVRTFKGSVPRYIRVQDQMMCYASIFPSEMRAGERYVIALEPNARGDYTHGVCVETALLREGNELFTFVRTEAGGYKPEKRFYAKYPGFVRRHGTPPPSPARAAAR